MDEGYIGGGGALAPAHPVDSILTPSACCPSAAPLESPVLLEPWREDDLMANFSQELEPLPPLFPFTPPTPAPATPYRCDGFVGGGVASGNQDVAADVLLSLKHAVVYPPSPPLYSTLHNIQVGSGYGGQELSSHHHPHHQAGMAPTSHHHYMFPSMSVNVSMTMHGCYAVEQSTCQTSAQMTWSGGGCTEYGGSYTGGDCMADYLANHDLNHLPDSSSDHHRHAEVHHHHHADSHHNDELHLLHDMKEPCSPGHTPLGSPPRPNLCRICGKTYARPSTLKTHLRTHSGEKPYRCDDCNKSFSQAANLTAHVRTHSGEKPFRCPICARRFSQSSSVTTHMRTHSGERPYRCRLCKKAFSDSSTLTKHLRIHSGEKPYQCKLCLLRFSQSGNLNRHMRVHGGALAC